MKFLTGIAAILLIISCNRQNPAGNETASKDEAPKTIAYRNKAFILSDSIRIYSPDRKFQTTISHVAGTLVSIDSMSLIKYFIGYGDTSCDLYNFIKIESEKINGWVYGKDVFELTDKKKAGLNINRDTSFTLDAVRFDLFVLRNFGIGFENEDGLTFCGEANPVALYNSRYDRLELIPVTDSGGSYGSAYLSLDNFDGWADKIEGLSYQDDELHMHIFREYQEGTAHFHIKVMLKPNGSRAIVTKAKEIVEHD